MTGHFYGHVVEEDPPNMPVPLGNAIQMSCFVDADHAGNKITRQSHTGIFILLNNTPVIAFSKRQNTCESSTYGSELVAMRIARDMISALRIKLKCFGIPIVLIPTATSYPLGIEFVMMLFCSFNYLRKRGCSAQINLSKS